MGAAAIDTGLPFLYPSLFGRQAIQCSTLRTLQRSSRPCIRVRSRSIICSRMSRAPSITDSTTPQPAAPILPQAQRDHLNPTPDSYSQHAFVDHCTLLAKAGSGGNGCVSFLREKYIEHGPPNGGNGGHGGNIYIQAVRGQTSLHNISRRSIVKAGRGGNGKGKSQGGERGKDHLITVPVGTVVREVWRSDPVAEIEEQNRESRRRAREARSRTHNADPEYQLAMVDPELNRDRWITYPGLSKQETASLPLPSRLRNQRPAAFAAQVPSPINLDLDAPMEQPLLLLAGAGGGLGNANFVTGENTRPQIATRGDRGAQVSLELELKILADVGLVGLPNAGKSTLLRAVSNSRTRIGNWAFTTLQPSIGTVVLDDNRGRPALRAFERDGRTPRPSFTIADIPGLIPDAHLDRGLGLGFLRHVERAAILAFVLDLSAGDAVAALKALWREVGMYESLREREVNAFTEERMYEDRLEDPTGRTLPKLAPPISSKPWFVVATKADLPGTQANFASLTGYLAQLGQGGEEHPSGREHGWRKDVIGLPISAIRAEGVERIPEVVVDLMQRY